LLIFFIEDPRYLIFGDSQRQIYRRAQNKRLANQAFSVLLARGI
jgi:hypothetical protein